MKVTEITKAFGDNVVLDKVSFLIEEGEKAAVVGVNGAGKSTLFKIIAGIMQADNGCVTLGTGVQAAYLPQNIQYTSEKTIYEEMLTAFSDILEAENKMRGIEKLMGGLTGERFEKLSAEYDRILKYYEENDGYSYKSLIRGVIQGLGLDGGDIAKKRISTLSGGQKTRVMLGVTLLKKPDILLLDEPTNHLDIDSVSWLEGYLKSYPKTVLIISHDRYFLDYVVTKIIEIEHSRASVYFGTYSAFMEKKRINYDIRLKQYKDAEKEIKKQEEAIRLLKSFNREKTVRRAESKEKQLAKMKPPEKPLNLPDNMKMSFDSKTESGFDVLEVSGVSKSFGGRKIFENASFEVKKGDRVALIGPNGIGKTTLLKIILGKETADLGFVKHGVNVRAEYYDQERQNLDESKSVMSHMQDKFPLMKDSEIRNILASFLFKGDDVYKNVSALSGGERGRLCFALIVAKKANLLILDEPTNHLDMYSKEILEAALAGFSGTMLYVSHDRYFINKTATRVLEMTKNGIKGYLGNYDYYMQKKSEEISEKEEKHEAAPKSKTDWHERKAEQSNRRRQENALIKIEAAIAETEQKIKKCDELMCEKEVFANAVRAKEVYDEKTALLEELDELYNKWEKADAEFQNCQL